MMIVGNFYSFDDISILIINLKTKNISSGTILESNM